MKMLLDFRCGNSNEVFERLEDSSTRTVRCACGGEAKRIITPIRCSLDGASGDFPGAHYRWIREHEQKKGKCGEGEW